MPVSIDLTANLSSADVRDAVLNADSSVRAAIAALSKAEDDTAIAAILCGIAYYQAPIGKGGRRVSGTLDELSALLKGHKWAGGTNMGLPKLQNKEQLTRFALAGLVVQQGGTILTRKSESEVVNTHGVLSLVNKAKVSGLGNEDILYAILGQGDAQGGYDSLVRAIAQATPKVKAPKVKDEADEADEAEADEAKTTTDADLMRSVLSILSGWKFDGTGSIDMVFDKVAEIAGASFPATV